MYQLTDRWELLVDDALLETVQDLRFALRPPTRRNVAFVADAPWEANNCGFYSVVDDRQQGVVRLYCRASHVKREGGGHLNGFARVESRDRGITFERIPMRRCEFEGGTDNNLIAYVASPQFPPAFIDTNPACPPEQRYKALSQEWEKIYAMCSPDGIDWQMMQDEPLEMPGHFDSVNTAFWDSVAGCYRSFTRYYEHFPENATLYDVLGPEGTAVRAIQGATSDDFLHWSHPEPNQYDDDFDRVQLYTNGAVPCPGAEHILIAFPARYIQHRIYDPTHPWPGTSDTLFMSSRDGVHWKRYMEAWLRPGLDERNWTERNNYVTWGLVQTSDTEWSMYVNEHFRKDDVPVNWRRLSIEPRRFVSLQGDYVGGEATTVPITFTGRRLALNYSTSAAGTIRAELLDAEGRPIPGFTREDMDDMYGDKLDGAVHWRGRDDLGELAGSQVRLRFTLNDADLFAFRIS